MLRLLNILQYLFRVAVQTRLASGLLFLDELHIGFGDRYGLLKHSVVLQSPEGFNCRHHPRDVCGYSCIGNTFLT